MTEQERLQSRGWPDEAVRELIGRAQDGDEAARAELVEANLRLVRSIVARFAAAGHDADDLFQIGCIGLLKAVDRFDLRFDVRFSTYAVPLILGEIRRHLRDDGPLRVSRQLKLLAQQARREADRLRAERGREPALDELAAALGVRTDLLVEALESARAPTSIHQTLHEGDGEPVFLLDKLGGEGEGGETGLVDRLAVRVCLSQLESRERAVIVLRFFRDMTQTQVAALLGVSQVQISRLERRALAQIRQLLADQSASAG
jgi:RNA polymerase sporulation-specific sigma factor